VAFKDDAAERAIFLLLACCKQHARPLDPPENGIMLEQVIFGARLEDVTLGRTLKAGQ
jgi:hypothetical protein